MPEAKDKRVYAGYYRRYDGKIIYVVMTATDGDTGEKTVIYQDYRAKGGGDYHTISKQSFCEIVVDDGKKKTKYRRMSQVKVTDDMIFEQEQNKLRGPVRKKDGRVNPSNDGIRIYQNKPTYSEYAKDIVTNYCEDKRRYDLCIASGKYVGVVGKEQFDALKEDLAFLTNCFNTTLKEYKSLFIDRYIRKKSIRTYANDKKINRGSVEYLQKKLFEALETELEIRDKSDGKRRIKETNEIKRF